MGAAEFGDAALAKEGHDRGWAWDFWRWHVLGSPYQRVSMDRSDVDDALTFLGLVRDVQRYVYSDPGDAAAGVAPSEATADEVDGWLGTGTLRRMQAVLDQHAEPAPVAELPTSEYLIVGGVKVPVEGVKVVSFDEPGGMDIKKAGGGAYPWAGGAPSDAASILGILHWDASLSAKGCFRSLVSQGYGSCFGVDNPQPDGTVTVYQWLDPGKYRAAHGGTKANNAAFSSFDLSNGVYPKFATHYRKVCGIDRPLIRVRWHGGPPKAILGMYRGQIVATLRVLRALSQARPGHHALTFPVWPDGKPVTGVFDGLFAGYTGVATHLHITAKKFDIAGFAEQVIVLLLTDEHLAEEFPELVGCFKLGDPSWWPWLAEVQQSWKWAEIGIG